MIRVENFRIFGFSIPGYLFVAASSWLSRILTAIISILSIRLIIDSLGVEYYAVYAVLIGVVSWFMLADFGIGQSLQNYISEARGKNQNYSDYILAASALTFMIVIAAIILVILFGAWPALELLSQFSSLSDSEKYISFTATSIFVILAAGGSVIYRIWYAEHKGYLANISLALAAVFGFVSIYCIAKFDCENKLLWFLVAANAPLATLSIMCFISRVLKLKRENSHSINKDAKKIIHRGSKFWLFNISAAAVLQVDYILLAQFVSAEQIAVYSIGVKVFSTMALMIGAVLQAFWPVCAEAVIQNDWPSIKSFTKKYILLSMVSVIFFTGLFLIFNTQISSIFSPNEIIVIPTSFIVLIGIMYLIRVWTDVYAIILQSMNDMKVLLLSVVAQAIIGLGLQIYLVPKYGINGTIIALALSWILTVAWFLPARVWTHQKKIFIK